MTTKLFLSALILFSYSAFATQELNKTIIEAGNNQQAGAASQAKIDGLYDKKREAVNSVRKNQSEIEQLEVYNRQLSEIIGNQNVQIQSLNKQLNDIETTQQGIMPLMERMINGLDKFISLDVPFLMDEREMRVANLRVLLLSSEITVSEKFRRVLEAYQIELEYGRTIESYKAKNDQGITLNYLRVGRSALLALTLDEKAAFAWDRKIKDWTSIDSSNIRSIKQGINIAKKQLAPSLINLPIQKTEGAR
ncbi:DUF3450 domain-containing protein [Oceaniserpentilla sp. 4NH20-0058]|uniref:DUF3450 domain-containing protein n=1 Tax=Oceaniserpentilla sp. 4NH20-0058 TaxID=3127660 RepID=UPI00333F878B